MSTGGCANSGRPFPHQQNAAADSKLTSGDQEDGKAVLRARPVPGCSQCVL